MGGELPQVRVGPRRRHAAVDGGRLPSPLPPQAEPVAVRRHRSQAGVQALVDDPVRRAEEQLVDEHRLPEPGHPAAHAYPPPSGTSVAMALTLPSGRRPVDGANAHFPRMHTRQWGGRTPVRKRASATCGVRAPLRARGLAPIVIASNGADSITPSRSVRGDPALVAASGAARGAGDGQGRRRPRPRLGAQEVSVRARARPTGCAGRCVAGPSSTRSPLRHAPSRARRRRRCRSI